MDANRAPLPYQAPTPNRPKIPRPTAAEVEQLDDLQNNGARANIVGLELAVKGVKPPAGIKAPEYIQQLVNAIAADNPKLAPLTASSTTNGSANTAIPGYVTLRLRDAYGSVPRHDLLEMWIPTLRSEWKDSKWVVGPAPSPPHMDRSLWIAYERLPVKYNRTKNANEPHPDAVAAVEREWRNRGWSYTDHFPNRRSHLVFKTGDPHLAAEAVGTPLEIEHEGRKITVEASAYPFVHPEHIFELAIRGLSTNGSHPDSYTTLLLAYFDEYRPEDLPEKDSCIIDYRFTPDQDIFCVTAVDWPTVHRVLSDRTDRFETMFPLLYEPELIYKVNEGGDYRPSRSHLAMKSNIRTAVHSGEVALQTVEKRLLDRIDRLEEDAAARDARQSVQNAHVNASLQGLTNHVEMLAVDMGQIKVTNAALITAHTAGYELTSAKLELESAQFTLKFSTPGTQEYEEAQAEYDRLRPIVMGLAKDHAKAVGTGMKMIQQSAAVLPGPTPSAAIASTTLTAQPVQPPLTPQRPQIQQPAVQIPMTPVTPTPFRQVESHAPLAAIQPAGSRQNGARPTELLSQPENGTGDGGGNKPKAAAKARNDGRLLSHKSRGRRARSNTVTSEDARGLLNLRYTDPNPGYGQRTSCSDLSLGGQDEGSQMDEDVPNFIEEPLTDVPGAESFSQTATNMEEDALDA